MIPKTQRFHGHTSLNLVYKKGHTVSLNQVSLKSIPARQDKNFRLAVVVSRKVDKSAVVRNRIRRRVYEIMRNYFPKINKKVDIIITIHDKHIATMKSVELEELFRELLSKAGLIIS